MAATYLSTRQGNDLRLIFEYLIGDVVVDLTGSEIVFRCTDEYGAELIRASSADPGDIVVLSAPLTGRWNFHLTAELTRLLSPGKVNRFEFERRSPDEKTLVWGYFDVELGVNDDG